MTVLQLVILGLVIGSNNLATALALGALGQAPRRWRVVVVFGVFEFVVPFLGIWMGHHASRWLVDHAGWIGAVLLAGLGLWSLVNGLRDTTRDDVIARRMTSFAGLVLLATGLSIDNLVVGFSLGLNQSEPVVVAGTIAAFSMAFTWLGMTLGDGARRHWEKYAEVGAGVLLLALAVASALGWI